MSENLNKLTEAELAHKLMADTPEILARLLREAVEQERRAGKLHEHAKELHEYATRLKDSATAAATLARGIMSLLGQDDPELWSNDQK